MDAGETSGPIDAGADSGPSDAAAADGGLVTYVGCPSRPGVLFCDDFEVADPDYDHWSYAQVQTGSVVTGSVMRTQVLKKNGSWSLLAATIQQNGVFAQARLATLVLNHQSSGHAWLRSYNFVPSSVVVTSSLGLMVMSDDTAPYDGVELRLTPNSVALHATNVSPVAPESPREFPRNAWVCVELHVFIDPSQGYYEAYFDGELVLHSEKTSTVPAHGYSAAEVGIHYAPTGQDDAQVFVDDVYIGRSRIPCD